MSLLEERVAHCTVANSSQNLGPTNRNNTEIENNTERDQKSSEHLSSGCQRKSRQIQVVFLCKSVNKYAPTQSPLPVEINCLKIMTIMHCNNIFWEVRPSVFRQRSKSTKFSLKYMEY